MSLRLGDFTYYIKSTKNKYYVPKTASYVRDMQHFISRLKTIGTLPEGALLVTLDVSSLYTNIPIGEGILAVAVHLRRDRTKDSITPYLLKLLELVLHSTQIAFRRRANVGPTSAHPSARRWLPMLAQRLFDRRPDVGPTSANHRKKITQCIASTSQIVHKQHFQCEFIMIIIIFISKIVK